MKKRNKIIILTIIIILLVVSIYMLLNSSKSKQKNSFSIDSEEKYIFVSDTKLHTMQNDGGSHTSIYYQVDLENNIIYKCKDVYKGFKGYVSQGELLSEIKISDTKAVRIKELFNKFIQEKDIKKNLKESNYFYYTLTTLHYNEIIVNDYDSINEFLNIVEE